MSRTDTEELSFLRLSKNCKKDMSGLTPYKFAVLGDCATQHLSKAIKGYAYEAGFAFDVFDADYNQILAQVMDPASELYTFAPKSMLLYLCTEKLYESFCETPLESRATFADTMFERIRGYWQAIGRHINVNILQFTFVEEDDRAFGDYGLDVEVSFFFQLKKLNYLLSAGSLTYKNVFLIDLNGIRAQLGSSVFCDRKLYYAAKMPISTAALPLVAKSVLDTVCAINGRIKKCVVLDLDNTLWGGVIGDDGLEGIQIGELGIGQAFTDLQTWLKELKNRGIILAVCSKNNEDTAKEPFIKHPEMTLRLDDISIFVANWNDKATNIRYIQKTLNIGMDSMVFLDDNPFERNLVRQMIPDITVPELPEDPSQYVSYLKQLNLFATISYSDEDHNRTKQYQAEVNRLELENQFESYDDYLVGLEMIAEAKPFDAFHFPRIAQLTQRSNQFNLRTVRYTEEQIKLIAEDPQHITLYFTLRDKFGDHGLISVVIMDKISEEEVFISEWLMSCRVLKRGMEEFIVNTIIETTAENGFKRVSGEYIRTPKNNMVSQIYDTMGFTALGDGKYTVDTDKYEVKKTFIKRDI